MNRRCTISISENLKKNISAQPTNNPSDFTKEFYVITDGSKRTTSRILAPKQRDKMIPIEFKGRTLKN